MARAQRKFQIPVSKAARAALSAIFTAKLVEIGFVLITAQNSGRKFQTHVSNSGEQRIPKHERQNSGRTADFLFLVTYSGAEATV